MIQCGINDNIIKESFSLCSSFNKYYILFVVKDINEFEYYKTRFQNQIINQKKLISHFTIFKNYIEIIFFNGSCILLYPVDCMCGLRAHKVYYSSNITDTQIINTVIMPQNNLEYKNNI